MHVVGERLHVGEAFVGPDLAVGSARVVFPGIVDVHVDIAGIAHGIGHHRDGESRRVLPLQQGRVVVRGHDLVLDEVEAKRSLAWIPVIVVSGGAGGKDVIKDNNGNDLIPDFKLKVAADVLRFIYVTDYKILGANWAVHAFVPLATGILGFCPLYRIVGINTCGAPRK